MRRALIVLVALVLLACGDDQGPPSVAPDGVVEVRDGVWVSEEGHYYAYDCSHLTEEERDKGSVC